MSIFIEKELHCCDKRVYVNYFELWDQSGFDERPVREQMKQKGKDENGIKMYIQAARRIAESGLQREALKVITNSPRVDRAAREKASNLLRFMS